MHKAEFQDVTIFTAEKDRYLVIEGKKDSENLIGKPVRIILSNKGTIPEFDEKEFEA